MLAFVVVIVKATTTEAAKEVVMCRVAVVGFLLVGVCMILRRVRICTWSWYAANLWLWSSGFIERESASNALTSIWNSSLVHPLSGCHYIVKCSDRPSAKSASARLGMLLTGTMEEFFAL